MSPSDIYNQSYIYRAKPVLTTRSNFSHTSYSHLLWPSFSCQHPSTVTSAVKSCRDSSRVYYFTFPPSLMPSFFATTQLSVFNTHAVFFPPGPLSFLITLSILHRSSVVTSITPSLSCYIWLVTWRRIRETDSEVENKKEHRHHSRE